MILKKEKKDRELLRGREGGRERARLSTGTGTGTGTLTGALGGHSVGFVGTARTSAPPGLGRPPSPVIRLSP